MPRRTRVALIGVGGMARHHIRQMLTMLDSTQISVLCEPSQTMVDEAGTIFKEAGLKAPPNQPDLKLLLKENAHQIGRLASGALVTLHGTGEAIASCASDVRLFCSKAILRTGIWGERLEIQRAGDDDLSPVAVEPSIGVWEQFLAVRSGHIENPYPPEVGLRMARLYDAILSSTAAGGMPVKCHVEMH
jgi:predicted dehydrogenase